MFTCVRHRSITSCLRKCVIHPLHHVFVRSSSIHYVMSTCMRHPYITSCLLRRLLLVNLFFSAIELSAELIDDSTPVSQSRHTLRFQPIACRSIMRCPRVLTRPEMAWQAFVPDIASNQLAVFDMAEKTPRKRNCCYGQCKSDERYPVKCAGVTF